MSRMREGPKKKIPFCERKKEKSDKNNYKKITKTP